MIGTKFSKPIQPDQLEKQVKRIDEDGNEYIATILVDNDAPNTDAKYAEAAAWCNENGKATIEDMGDWYEVVAIPEPTLEEAKALKLAGLKVAFQTAAETAHCPSSLGFEIDANDTANRNVASLIRQLIAGVIETATFRDYNNQYHPGLTLTDLNTIQGEIDVNGSRLYAVKWAYEQQIAQAQDVEALEAITFTF